MSNDDVFVQGFDLRPEWWRSRAPEPWSAFLCALPVSERGRRYHHISRADFFTQARDNSPDGNGSLLVACYAWGTGPSGWLVPRRARVFRDTSPEVLGRKLSDARRVLNAEGPVAAYANLSDGGPNRIKHMRASFFTKFLYAADEGSGRSDASALILDQFVAIALNDLHQWDLLERGPWSPDTYGRWIEHARGVALEASSAKRQVRADAVEFAYFKHGQQVARARRTRK